jgi:hypothetical protein
MRVDRPPRCAGIPLLAAGAGLDLLTFRHRRRLARQRSTGQVRHRICLAASRDSAEGSRFRNVATWVSVAMRRVIACSRSSIRTGVSERAADRERRIVGEMPCLAQTWSASSIESERAARPVGDERNAVNEAIGSKHAWILWVRLVLETRAVGIARRQHAPARCPSRRARARNP